MADVVGAQVLVIWTVVLIAAAGWAASRRVDTPAVTSAPPPGGDRPHISLAILATWVTAFIGAMLWRESFTDYDASFFTNRTLLGLPIPPPVWPEDGRFWPLGFQEFNLIGQISQTAVGYQVLPAAQVVAFVGVVYRVLREFSNAARAALVIGLLITPGIAISLTGVVFPERNVLLLIAIVILAFQRWDRRPSGWLLVGLVMTVQAVLYFKEPMFLFLGTFAAARVGLRVRSARAVGRSLGRGEILPELAIGVLCVVFVLLFVASQSGGEPLGYATRFQVSRTAAVTGYALANLLPFVFLLVVAFRVARFALGRYEPDRLWDPLAVGACAYIAFYFGIRMYRPYYLAPADLVAVIYLARVVRDRVVAARPLEGLILATVSVLLVFQSVGSTALWAIDRKATMIVKAELADELLRARSSGDAVRDLYFPWASPFVIAEWASYLAWRGVPIEKWAADPGSAGGGEVRLWSPREFRGALCVRWLPFACRSGAAPPAGAIVVSLPDDGAAREPLASSYSTPTSVTTVEPPGWAIRIGRSLGAWSAVTTHRGGLPRHWLLGEMAEVP